MTDEPVRNAPGERPAITAPPRAALQRHHHRHGDAFAPFLPAHPLARPSLQGSAAPAAPKNPTTENDA